MSHQKGKAYIQILDVTTDATAAKTGEYRMRHAHRSDSLTIITSEPLTDDVTDWCVHCMLWRKA